MSFASDTREEMVRIEGDCEMCNKAVLSALVRVDGTIYLSGAGKYRIEIATDFASVGRFVVNMLHSLYDLKTEISYRRSVLHHTQNYGIDVPYQDNIEFALKDLGILEDNNSLVRGVSKQYKKRKCCKRAYLRGVFLGSGFIADPKSSFHFEASVSTQELADDIVKFMKDLGVSARIVTRRNNFLIYMKSGAEIHKFLQQVGAKDSAGELEKVRKFKSLRNDVNRSINAEIANQNRTTSASYDQIRNIRIILEHNGFNSLSPAIRDFVQLRAEHPDASLKELGEMCDPPLSKSAINHRARRLEEIVKQNFSD